MTVDNNKIYYNIRPVVIVAAGFLLGILSAYLIITNRLVLALVLLVLAFIVLTTLTIVLWSKKNSNNILVLITLIVLIFGFVYSLVRGVNLTEVPLGKEVEVSSTVYEISSETKEGNNYNYELILNIKTKDSNTFKARANIVAPKRIFVGTKLDFACKIFKRKVDDYTLSSGVYYELDNVINVNVGIISGAIPNLKHRLLTALENTMPNAFGVNYALLTGDTQYISEELLLKYRETGVAHIFAVSGLHIGLMFIILTGILKLIKVKPVPRVITTVLFLFLYVAFCGFSPSSLRAFIIIIIIMIAGLFGLKPDSSSSLFLSAVIVLLINPFDFINVGFILSFSIYLALTIMTRPFTKIFSKIFPEGFAKVIAPYVVASIVSFPISLHYFSYVQPLSFALNIIIIPLISFFYTFSLVGGLLLLIFPNVSLFSIVPEMFLTFVNSVALSLDTSRFLIKDLNVSWAMPTYYAYFYLLCGKINIDAKILRILRIIFLILTILIVILLNVIT